MKSLKENERELKQQEQDELITMCKEEVSQVNKTFKIPKIKKVKKSINQNGKNLAKVREQQPSLRRQDSLRNRLLISSTRRRQLVSSTTKFNNNNLTNSSGRTRNSSRQFSYDTTASSTQIPTRQSSRKSIRSSKLNRTF